MRRICMTLLLRTGWRPRGAGHRTRSTEARGARPRRRRAAVLTMLCATPFLGRPAPAAAQTLAELTASPEEAAGLFIRSVRTLRWSAAAQFMDPETLALFRDVVTMITEVDRSGELLRFLTGADTAAYRALEPREVFARALDVLTGEMAGLAHSLADRDDRILGHVPEGADSAHVVYRTQMGISGSVPEVNLMQMRRGPEGWRVLWSEELDVLETALRGAARLRAPGPGADGGPSRPGTTGGSPAP